MRSEAVYVVAVVKRNILARQYLAYLGEETTQRTHYFVGGAFPVSTFSRGFFEKFFLSGDFFVKVG